MKPLRIACVRYLNTAPLIEGLEKLEGAQLIPTVPSRIAEMVRRDEADVGLVSLVDAVRDDPPGGTSAGASLALLPAGMIGCDGATMTVRLFSSVPLEQIERLYADTDSHTSVILCQVILRKLYGISPPVVQFDVRERIAVGSRGASEEHQGATLDDAWPAAILLIGDKVVTDAPPASRYEWQLDLGEAWKQMTGLPFVYAMWACRAERADSPEIRLAAALLDRQLRHNLTRLDWIAARRAAEHRWPQALAHVYLSDLLRFEVGARERAAVGRFLADAAELGLLERGEPVWVDTSRRGVAASGSL